VDVLVADRYASSDVTVPLAVAVYWYESMNPAGVASSPASTAVSPRRTTGPVTATVIAEELAWWFEVSVAIATTVWLPPLAGAVQLQV
jgi:hypothetical protein